MDLQAILFLVVFASGSFFSLYKGPFYGLLTYIHVYFNIPSHQYWGGQVPDLRWSFYSAIILLVSCCLHQDKLSEPPFYSNILFKLLSIYFILVIFTAFISPYPDRGFARIYEFLRYVIIFALITKVITSLKQYQYTVLLIIFEIYNLSRLAGARFHGGRLDSVGTVDASTANQFSGLIVITLPFVLGLFFSGNKYIRLFCIFVSPFIVNAFMMCGSRGGFLGLAVVLFIVLYWTINENKHRWKIICSVGAGIFLVFFLMDQGYKDRLFSMSSDSEEHGLASVSAGRTDVWWYGIEMAKDYPFGAGGGSFLLLSPHYMPQSSLCGSVGVRASHSTYILTLVEQGIAGLIVYCLYLFIPFIKLSRLTKTTGDQTFINDSENPMRQSLIFFCIGLQASIAGLAMSSIFADRLYFELLYWIGAFFICLQSIEANISKKEAEQ